MIQAKLDALEIAEQAESMDEVNELEAQLWLDGPAQPAGRVGGGLRELFLSMNGVALRAAPLGEEIEPPAAWPRLDKLTPPSLVIWGTLDFPHLLERMRHLVATLPGARSHVIVDTAHLPNLERPDEFNAVLAEFLAPLEA